MPNEVTEKASSARRIRHSGRDHQVLIYLGKQFRFFINENDWKVLPMAAIIAALVGMVIRRRFFVNMEGSLIGAFALTCVAIWNGCFNSIQAVCRERPIIKREHRSGMHITSYVAAHMIYQFLLCLGQTVLTMYVLRIMDVPIPREGFMTPFMLLDIGISMLLISYASDMLSLFISSISHTTTGAMTVMPFVLIFQLVFSGGIIPLPAWSQALSNYTISNYGIKAIASQSGYNERPMVTAWNTLESMRNNEIGGTVTLGQILDLLDSPAVEKRKDMELFRSYTVGEAAEILSSAEESLHLRDIEITHAMSLRDILTKLRGIDALSRTEIFPATETAPAQTVGGMLDTLMADESAQAVLDEPLNTQLTLGQVLDFLHAQDAADFIVEHAGEESINPPVTLGQVADFLKNNQALQQRRDRAFTFKTTIGDIFELFGEDNIKALVQEKTAAASYKAMYEKSSRNIVNNWLMLGVFAIAFALLSTIFLKLIDHDKR